MPTFLFKNYTAPHTQNRPLDNLLSSSFENFAPSISPKSICLTTSLGSEERNWNLESSKRLSWFATATQCLSSAQFGMWNLINETTRAPGRNRQNGHHRTRPDWNCSHAFWTSTDPSRSFFLELTTALGSQTKLVAQHQTCTKTSSHSENSSSTWGYASASRNAIRCKQKLHYFDTQSAKN